MAVCFQNHDRETASREFDVSIQNKSVLVLGSQRHNGLGTFIENKTFSETGNLTCFNVKKHSFIQDRCKTM